MENPGGRVFFTNMRRSLVDEDEIQLVSVGIDIGSSTTHLAFSRITLEREDTRYIVSQREVLFESDILLTPYAEGNTIDTAALGEFFEAQYRLSGIAFETIDTGALILTGTAVRRANARAIGELFAAAAGKFVSVSAGDGMEAILSAYGSGAVALSNRLGRDVVNIDIGGGTTKITRCAQGKIVDLTAIDIGARLIALDAAACITRLEPAGRAFAAECGLALDLGQTAEPAALDALATRMAERLFELLRGPHLSPETQSLLRLDALRPAAPPAIVTFSGGVSEYIYQRNLQNHGDLGSRLAGKILEQLEGWGPEIYPSVQGIRATVIGASQYTMQISGSTVFISDMDLLPLKNIPTISLETSLEEDELSAELIATKIHEAIARLGEVGEERPLALCYAWGGSASYQRLDAFCRGVVAGFAARLSQGLPLVLVGTSDIGGLIGLHLAEEMKWSGQVVSIDGITLNEFDFIDIGTMLEGAGAVPVVIKSLIFPTMDIKDQPKIKVVQ